VSAEFQQKHAPRASSNSGFADEQDPDDYFRFTTGRPGWSATGRFQPRRNAMRRMTMQSMAPLIVVAVGGQ